MKKIKVDKVILYYMDRVDPDGNLYRFYVYKDMASEIEYFCTEETGNMTIPIGEGKYIEIVPREIVKIPVRGYRKLTGIWNREACNGKGWYRLFNYFKYKPTLCYFKKAGHDECNWKTFFYENKHDLRDVIDAIVMKHIEQKDIVKYLKKGEANGISFTYNRGGNVWELKHKTSPYIGQEFFPSDLTDFDCRGELIEDLDDEDLLDIISKYGKDVVAIEWSTRGYSQGDYIKGIAYVTKEKYDNEVCNKEGDWKEDCAKIIDNEVKSIGMWMWGDVKGYVLEKKVAFTKKYKDKSREDEDCEEWEEVDSCWGCYEETDELIKEVMIENGLEE